MKLLKGSKSAQSLLAQISYFITKYRMKKGEKSPSKDKIVHPRIHCFVWTAYSWHKFWSRVVNVRCLKVWIKSNLSVLSIIEWPDWNNASTFINKFITNYRLHRFRTHCTWAAEIFHTPLLYDFGFIYLRWRRANMIVY